MPLNPKNFSGPEKNTSIKTPRNDTVPSKDKVNNPSTFDRSPLTKNDPHYKGDNARFLMQEQQPPYTSKEYKGSINVGIDDNLWQYSDEQIRKTLQQKLSEKYEIPAEEFYVIIHRHTGRIEYDYKYYLMQAVNTRLNKKATFSELEKGTTFNFSVNAFKKLFTEEDTERYGLRGNDVWIKSEEDKARLWKNKNIKITLTNPDKTIVFVDAETELKKASDKLKGIPYNKLKEGEQFVFVSQPDVIKDNYDYEDIFEKVDENTILGPDNQEIDIEDMGHMDVVKRDVWEKQYKYKKEGIESALSSVFSNYKTQNTKYGTTATLPVGDFMKILEKYNVSESNFNDMTEEKNDVLAGKYVGQKEDYMWIIRGDEIEITKA